MYTVKHGANLEDLTPFEVLTKMWKSGGLSLKKGCQLTRHLLRHDSAMVTWSAGGFYHFVALKPPALKV